MRDPALLSPRRVSRALALGAATILACGLAACEKRHDAGTQAAATGPIKVGVFMDLSGQTSSFGQSSVAGAKMAVEQINAAGGVDGRPIELVIEDDQGRPEQAATVVTKLINQDKVAAILGEVASSNSLAAAPIAQQAKVPMITPASTNPKVTQVGDYIFRVCFIDPFQGEAMATFASRSLRTHTAAILLDTNADYSRGLADFFEKAYTAQGGTIVDKQSYTNTDRDFSGQLTAIKAKNPEVLYVPGYYTQVGVIVRQARQLGYEGRILGGDGWDAPQLFELGGEALNGTFITNHYSVDDPSPVIQKFIADFKAGHDGAAPDAMAVLAYDAVNVLAAAIKKAGGTDPEDLRKAIRHTTDFEGISGKITINENRDAMKPAVVLEVQNGKFNYRQTVPPFGTPAIDLPPAAPAGSGT